MAQIVFAAPSAVQPGTGVGESLHLRHVWTGWDGSVWNLSDTAGGVFLAGGGLRGLATPTFQRYTSSAAGVPGSRSRGSRAQEREVFWPVAVLHDRSSAGWIELDRAFWRTMSPRRTGVWTVEHALTGVQRSLTCRFVDDGGHAFTSDPTRRGAEVYGVNLVAEDPFWRGAPLMRSWAASAPVDFFGAGAPSFNISSSSTLAGATIANPGDEDAHPIWVINGPTTSAEVGVGSSIIVVPFAIADGKSVVIDTRPTRLTAKLIDTPPAVSSAAQILAWVEAQDATAVSKTRDLGATTAFGAIEPGELVSLSLNMVGAGSVRAIIEPLYWRAW